MIVKQSLPSWKVKVDLVAPEFGIEVKRRLSGSKKKKRKKKEKEKKCMRMNSTMNEEEQIQLDPLDIEYVPLSSLEDIKQCA